MQEAKQDIAMCASLSDSFVKGERRAVPFLEQEPGQTGGGAPIAPVLQSGDAHATEEAAFAGCCPPCLESAEHLDELGVRVEGRDVASGLCRALVRRLMGS